MAAFAEAVAAGEFEKAEGWLAVARLSEDRVLVEGPARSWARRLAPQRHRQRA